MFYYEHYNYAYLADQDIRLAMAEIYTTCNRIHEYLQAWKMGERKTSIFDKNFFSEKFYASMKFGPWECI